MIETEMADHSVKQVIWAAHQAHHPARSRPGGSLSCRTGLRAR